MESLARRLWEARQNNSVVNFADAAVPASIEEAYSVQDEAVRLSGLSIRGFKVGSTSKEAQRLLGTSQPGAGPILEPYLHGSPARLVVTPTQSSAVEGEFAFRLGRDLPPCEKHYAREELTEAIDAVAGAIEVVGTRIAGGLAGKGRFLVTATRASQADLRPSFRSRKPVVCQN
jgi:2-keto-4-pentenoate hydratase